MCGIRIATLGLTLVCLLVLSSCQPASEASVDPPRSVRVSVQQVKAVHYTSEMSYSGVVDAVSSQPQAFAVQGIVQEVLVEEGQPVHAGQLLARLDDSTFRNALQAAEAAHDRALDAVSRLRPIHERGNLPDIEMVKVESQLSQSEAVWQQAQQNLADCSLHALRDGYVGSRRLEEGSGALPGMAVLTIVQVDSLNARIAVHESEIDELSLGMIADIRIPALSGVARQGRVRQIGVVADALSHTYQVELRMANPEQRVRPGMLCEVLLHRPAQSLVQIPVQAMVLDDAGNSWVYVIHNGVAQRRNVTRGPLLRDNLAVLEGLDTGEQVVTGGMHMLYDGARVTLISTGSEH